MSIMSLADGQRQWYGGGDNDVGMGIRQVPSILLVTIHVEWKCVEYCKRTADLDSCMQIQVNHNVI